MTASAAGVYAETVTDQGAGVAGAPTTDIAGVTRKAPYAAEAYSYPF
jgi:hypothetical protein